MTIQDDKVLTLEDIAPTLDSLSENSILTRFIENPCILSTALTKALNVTSVNVCGFLDWVCLKEEILNLEAFLLANFTNAQVVESEVYRVTSELGKNEDVAIELSGIFHVIETNKELLNVPQYSVSQTTLEQIFNSFAAKFVKLF